MSKFQVKFMNSGNMVFGLATKDLELTTFEHFCSDRDEEFSFYGFYPNCDKWSCNVPEFH